MVEKKSSFIGIWISQQLPILSPTPRQTGKGQDQIALPQSLDALTTLIRHDIIGLTQILSFVKAIDFQYATDDSTCALIYKKTPKIKLRKGSTNSISDSPLASIRLMVPPRDIVIT